MSEHGKIFIVSGPSGVGKSTLLNYVFAHRERVFFSVSATTRAPREGETDGVQYFFVSKETFKDMIARDEFLEYAEFVENSYGTPQGPVEEKLREGYDVFMDIDVQGKLQVKAKRPDAVSVFIAPPSMEALGERLRGRSTEDEATIEKRLGRAREEIAHSRDYDYIVINDSADRASAELLEIVEKESER